MDGTTVDDVDHVNHDHIYLVCQSRYHRLGKPCSVPPNSRHTINSSSTAIEHESRWSDCRVAVINLKLRCLGPQDFGDLLSSSLLPPWVPHVARLEMQVSAEGKTKPRGCMGPPFRTRICIRPLSLSLSVHKTEEEGGKRKIVSQSHTSTPH